MKNNIEIALELHGIRPDLYESYDVLCLPENFGALELLDSSETLDFYKELKSKGISCANSYDLDLETKTIARRSDDIWIGQIFIINDFIIPAVMTILEHFIVNSFSFSNKQISLTGDPTVHIELKLHKNGKISKIKFDGDKKDLLKIIKALKKNGKISS